jgi:hypothetical protein
LIEPGRALCLSAYCHWNRHQNLTVVRIFCPQIAGKMAQKYTASPQAPAMLRKGLFFKQFQLRNYSKIRGVSAFRQLTDGPDRHGYH